MVTNTHAANGAQQTHHGSSTTKATKTEEQKNKEFLTSLLTMVFTLAMATNSQSTLATAGKYAAATGQTVLLMNSLHNSQQGQVPFDNPYLQTFNRDLATVTEGLVEGFFAKGNKGEEKPPEPQSLADKVHKMSDLRQEADDIETAGKREIETHAAAFGKRVEDIDEASELQAHKAKKAAKKEKHRAKAFQAQIDHLAQRRTELKEIRTQAKLNGDKKTLASVNDALAQLAIEEKVFDMVPKTKRGNKGILEQTLKVRDEIFQEIGVYNEGLQAKKARGFFWTRKSRDAYQTAHNALRQEAAQEAKTSLAEITESARKSLKLRDDKGLSDLINTYIGA